MSELDSLRRRQRAAEAGDGEGGGELGSLRGEVSALREAVRERDRAVDQLKQQMKYYVAFAENSLQGRATPPTTAEEELEKERDRLEEELKEAREQIRGLNSHNSELRSQIEVLSSPTREHSNSPKTDREEEEEEEGHSRHSCSSAMSEDADSSAEESSGASSTEASRHSSPAKAKTGEATAANSVIPVISHDVAFLKLEQKFNQAMERVASLATEKDYLEHLNVQLQEETETVGKLWDVTNGGDGLYHKGTND